MHGLFKKQTRAGRVSQDFIELQHYIHARVGPADRTLRQQLAGDRQAQRWTTHAEDHSQIVQRWLRRKQVLICRLHALLHRRRHEFGDAAQGTLH